MLPEPPQRAAGATPVLRDGEVHVWRSPLDQDAERVAELARHLSADERERANAFCFQRDRERYIVARGVLRAILGEYLAAAPQRIRFRYRAGGKPALGGELARHPLRFNLSHSGGLALYALTLGREIGVDLERADRAPAVEQIAERFFAPQEARALRAIPAGSRQAVFLTYWTRKEAYVKARGEGLALALDRFDVSSIEGGVGAPSTVGWADRREPGWTIHDIDAGPGYRAALAVERGRVEVRYWDLPRAGSGSGLPWRDGGGGA